MSRLVRESAPTSPTQALGAGDLGASLALPMASTESSRKARLELAIRAHGPRLLAVARRLLGSTEEAEDALQDAFALAFVALGSFEERSQLSTWLHRITVNAALSRLRSRRRNLESLESDGARTEASTSDEEVATAVDELFERREDGARLLACIEELPEAYRTVIRLRDVEELDTHAVALKLGVSDNVVKVRLHRARQALKVRLAPAPDAVLS